MADYTGKKRQEIALNGGWSKEKTKLGYSIWTSLEYPDYYIEQNNHDGTMIVRSRKEADEANPTKFILNPLDKAKEIVEELSRCDRVVLLPLTTS